MGRTSSHYAALSEAAKSRFAVQIQGMFLLSLAGPYLASRHSLYGFFTTFLRTFYADQFQIMAQESGVGARKELQ